MKTFLLSMTLFCSLSFAQQPLTPTAEYIKLSEERAQQLVKITAPGGSCSSADITCVSDKVRAHGIRTATDASLGYAMITQGLYKLQPAECKDPCMAARRAQTIEAVLSFFESIQLDQLYSYKLVKSGESEGDLIRATEDLSLFKISQQAGNSLIQLQTTIKGETKFSERLATLMSAKFLKNSYLAKLPTTSDVYTAFAKTKNPEKQAEHERTLAEFKRLTGN